jgi:hypothetical protein
MTREWRSYSEGDAEAEGAVVDVEVREARTTGIKPKEGTMK